MLSIMLNPPICIRSWVKVEILVAREDGLVPVRKRFSRKFSFAYAAFVVPRFMACINGRLCVKMLHITVFVLGVKLSHLTPPAILADDAGQFFFAVADFHFISLVDSWHSMSLFELLFGHFLLSHSTHGATPSPKYSDLQIGHSGSFFEILDCLSCSDSSGVFIISL